MRKAQVIVGNVNRNQTVRGNLPGNQFLSQRRFHVHRDKALQWPGPVRRQVTRLGNPGLGGWRNRQIQLLVVQASRQVANQLDHDLLDVGQR